MVGRLADAPALVTDVVAALAPELTARRPSDEEWSIDEVFGHIRAADAIWVPRVLAALSTEGVTMPALDERAMQDVQARAGTSASLAVAQWTLARGELVAILERLEPAEWARTFVHAELGTLTVEQACTMLATHEGEHLDQLRDTADRVEHAA